MNTWRWRRGGWGRLLSATLLWLVGGCGGEEEDPAARRSLLEATITAEVRSRLLATETLRALPLAVETRGATVTVTGAVHDSAQARAIRAVAARVKGVERLELKLRVVRPPDSAPSPTPPPGKSAR